MALAGLVAPFAEDAGAVDLRVALGLAADVTSAHPGLEAVEVESTPDESTVSVRSLGGGRIWRTSVPWLVTNVDTLAAADGTAIVIAGKGVTAAGEPDLRVRVLAGATGATVQDRHLVSATVGVGAVATYVRSGEPALVGTSSDGAGADRILVAMTDSTAAGVTYTSTTRVVALGDRPDTDVTVYDGIESSGLPGRRGEDASVIAGAELPGGDIVAVVAVNAEDSVRFVHVTVHGRPGPASDPLTSPTDAPNSGGLPATGALPNPVLATVLAALGALATRLRRAIT